MLNSILKLTMNTPTAPFAEKLITGEERALIPGLGRCELVAGKIVTLNPTNWKHGDFVSEIDWHLEAVLDVRWAGEHDDTSEATDEVNFGPAKHDLRGS